MITQRRSSARDTSEIRSFLLNELSVLLARPSDQIRTDQSIFEFGLDSSAAIGLTDLLAEWLDREVDPTLVYDHPTIEGLSEALSGESR